MVYSNNTALEKFILWKERGFYPDKIYDIGAHIGSWTIFMKQIFPMAQYYLFEANEDNINKSQSTHFFNVLLGKEDGKELDFYMSNTASSNTGDSVYKELTSHYNDYYTVKKITKTLDNYIAELNIDYPDFIKIDTQGSELDILDGAQKCLENATMVLLEVSIHQYNKDSPLIADVIKYMDLHNYEIIDIIDTSIINTYLYQLDILFSKKQSGYRL